MKCKVNRETLVRICIEGNEEEPGLYDDDGLIRRLQEWGLEEEVYSQYTFRAGHGAYDALWAPEDAVKVLSWLKKHNC